MFVRNSLIIISGPSGAGKGTLCKELLKKNKNIYCGISATSRSPRGEEIKDLNYYYIGVSEFLKKIKEKKFLEYAKVYNNYYGTLKSEVSKNLKIGYDVILEIDIQGAMQIKEKYKNVICIFILPPSFTELKNRINKRGRDSEKDIKKRMKEVFNELGYVSKYDYVIVNDTIERAVTKIEAILLAEKCHLLKNNIDINKFIKE